MKVSLHYLPDESLLVPVLYWRFIERGLLQWAVLAVFLGVLVDACFRSSLWAVLRGLPWGR